MDLKLEAKGFYDESMLNVLDYFELATRFVLALNFIEHFTPPFVDLK